MSDQPGSSDGCCDGCGAKNLRDALTGLHPDDVAALAGEFEVARSTVDRWRRGTACPHQLVAGKIIRRACELRRARSGRAGS